MWRTRMHCLHIMNLRFMFPTLTLDLPFLPAKLPRNAYGSLILVKNIILRLAGRFVYAPRKTIPGAWQIA